MASNREVFKHLADKVTLLGMSRSELIAEVERLQLENAALMETNRSERIARLENELAVAKRSLEYWKRQCEGDKSRAALVTEAVYATLAACTGAPVDRSEGVAVAVERALRRVQ